MADSVVGKARNMTKMNKDILKAEQEKIEGKNLSDLDLKKIEGLYNKKIIIPRKKNKVQILLCPAGLVGAGKTTVVRPISDKLNLLRISTDEIRKILISKKFNLLRTTEIASNLVVKYLKQGYGIALDADCVSPSVQRDIKKLQKEYNVIPIWIHINPKEKFILNRLKSYNHTWLFKDEKDAVDNYKRRKPLHKKYLGDIDFYSKFDTSKDNLNMQISEFVNKIEKDFNL